MPERNGQSDLSKSSSDLETLEAKLASARARHAPEKTDDKRADNSILGMAWRMSTELLVSVGVGFFLGRMFDTYVGTAPWGTFVGLGFGIAAGFMSVFRTAAAMEAKSAHIPLGEAMPDPEDDE